MLCIFFFFTDPSTTEIYTLSLHDALPISVPAELLRLQDDVTRLGRIDAQGLLQSVDGLRKPTEAEQRGPPFAPGPPIPAVRVDHPLVGSEGLLLAAEQDQQFGPIEPDGHLFRPIPQETVITVEGGFVIAFPQEGEGLFLQAGRDLLLVDLAGDELVSNRPGQGVRHSLTLRERLRLGRI